MSVVALRTGQDHTTLIGEEQELREHLSGLVAQGRLQPSGLVSQGRTPDGECFVRVRLADPGPRRRVRRGLVVAGGVAAAGLLGVAAWGAWLVVAWLWAHLGVIIAVLAVIVLAVIGLGSAKACTGIHCPGCKHK